MLIKWARLSRMSSMQFEPSLGQGTDRNLHEPACVDRSGPGVANAFADAGMPPPLAAKRAEAFQIASFDVFDTILSRIYATPEDVREHLEESLRQSGLIPYFVRFAEARS